ncbi:hypothetical protein L9F63_006075, partial [Diploptera punctata]
IDESHPSFLFEFERFRQEVAEQLVPQHGGVVVCFASLRNNLRRTMASRSALFVSHLSSSMYLEIDAGLARSPKEIKIAYQESRSLRGIPTLNAFKETSRLDVFAFQDFCVSSPGAVVLSETLQMLLLGGVPSPVALLSRSLVSIAACRKKLQLKINFKSDMAYNIEILQHRMKATVEPSASHTIQIPQKSKEKPQEYCIYRNTTSHTIRKPQVQFADTLCTEENSKVNNGKFVFSFLECFMKHIIHSRKALRVHIINRPFRIRVIKVNLLVAKRFIFGITRQSKASNSRRRLNVDFVSHRRTSPVAPNRCADRR